MSRADPSRYSSRRTPLSARPEDSGRQPWLHDLEIAAHGNLTCVSDRTGDLDSPGTGLFVDDRRVLTRFTLTADDERPVRVSAHSSGATTRVLSVARHLGDEGPDPTIEVHRRRRLVDGGLREEVAVVSRWHRPLRCRLRLEAAGDGAELQMIKGGHAPARLLPRDRRRLTRSAWRDARHETRVSLAGARAAVTADGTGVLEWDVEVAAGAEARWTSRRRGDAYLAHRLRRRPRRPSGRLGRRRRTGHRPPAGPGRGARRSPTSPSWCWPTPTPPTDAFAAAGTPVVPHALRPRLPLGRAADAALRHRPRRRHAAHPGPPPGPGRRPGDRGAAGQDPARGPLRTRRRPARACTSRRVYYGTVDATPLWVGLLHDAWRWGLRGRRGRTSSGRTSTPPSAGCAAPPTTSPDGFLRYVDATGTGLANQGWKDSGDAMRRRDGTVADGADRPGRDPGVRRRGRRRRRRAAGAGLRRERRRAPRAAPTTWRAGSASGSGCATTAGAYLAMALDRDGDPVDGVGSNMGHVLGTGTAR